MKQKKMIFGIFIFYLFSCAGEKEIASLEVRDLLQYVDQHLGIEVGKCSFGVSLPFGSIRPCPHTPDSPHTGYAANHPINGFTVINTGSVYRYGNFLVSPQTGLDCWDDNVPTDHDSGKSDEEIRPDYYTVNLTKFGIRTEIASAQHASIFRFTYPETTDGVSSLVIYPSHTLQAKSTFATAVYNSGTNSLTGYLVLNDGWYFSHGMKIYYAIRFGKPATSYGMFRNHERKLYGQTDSISGDGIGCYLKFNTVKDEKVFMKVAISTKSIANAEHFLEEEIPGWDFDKVQLDAADIWNKALSSILIDDETVSGDEKTLFYTCLYHALISPKDRTGDCPWNYAGSFYDDHICVWDTYRTLFPLLTLIKESVVRDNIRSFCELYKHYGYASDAVICGTGDMIQGGDAVDVLIADAYVKNVSGIEWNEAYEVQKGHATVSGRTPFYRENDRGWVVYNSIPVMSHATASKTLEFAYNDYCASVVAGGLGKKDEQSGFLKRSSGWRNLWDASVISEGFRGFIQSKDSAGNFVALDPKTNPLGPFSLHFYEGDSWTYSFYAPHQMPELITLMGGEDIFIKRLEYYVANRIEIYNEPCFLTPFLFAYGKRPDLTSYYAREVSKTFTRKNYPGDDDSGAMSSWFIFSRLGFFPVAGQDFYMVNGPRYKKVTLQMENGKKIVIYGNDASEENVYIKSASLNGKSWKKAWLRHNDISNGAELKFNMTPDATSWGNTVLPPSAVDIQ
ncbi:MAG: GH92 family glycosyl hydrolase [Tannerella sp.]|jgi:predicted alpha-1,2-mannosidase|nr:GH92 family glycosyl hydrolase [Tannerella sp.]